MDFLVKNWMLIAVAVISGAMLLWPLLQRRLSSMKGIGTSTAIQLINQRNALLLDVRETQAYEGGRLPNAVHVPLSQLASRGAELAKFTSRPVVAYCDRGNRSRMAAGPLAKIGFTDVYSLNGGIAAWKDAGLPIEK